MDQLSVALNEMLVEIFHNILRLEELTIKRAGNLNLTINEMHLIECVGKGGEEGLTIGELAGGLKIKSPSVTVAAKKLEAKGYVRKVACEDDGRVVRIQLTREGRRVNAYHSEYHRIMVKSLSRDLTEQEKTVLLGAVKKLNAYFLESIGEVI